MQLIRLVKSGPDSAVSSLIVVTIVSGLSSAFLIGLINHAAELIAFGEPTSLRLVLLYAVLFLIFVNATSIAWRKSNRLLQSRLSALRLRIAGTVRQAPLRGLEQLEHSELLVTLNRETNSLSANMPLLTGAVQSAVLLLGALLYIASLSFVAFLVFVTAAVIGGWAFWRRRLIMNDAMVEVFQSEADVVRGMVGFTKGFKEIRLNAARNIALFDQFKNYADTQQSNVTSVASTWITLIQFSSAFIYAMLGALIFIVPAYYAGHTDIVYKIVAVSAFCLGPLASITSVSHLFANAEVGLTRIAEIEAKLNALKEPAHAYFDPDRFHGLKRIEARDITFEYRTANGDLQFTSGPWDLTVNASEILFVTGGNGSGKSTAMKVLCGLYPKSGGEIKVDGERITHRTQSSYSEIFAAIFSDFHLFDQMFGLDDIDPETVTHWLKRMQLDDKVTYSNGRFSTLDLSTGQRKRLAMITALLEDRDVYIFDEWAADQDSHFRDVFYKELLPDLKAKGKAVIVVSHDDRYWHLCDRRVHFDMGRIQAQQA